MTERQEAWFTDYIKLNQAFADAIVAEYRPGDSILVNDYHLMLVRRYAGGMTEWSAACLAARTAADCSE